jgi:hypothetical protein
MEIAQEIKQITQIIELQEIVENKSLTYLMGIRKLLHLRSEAKCKIKKVLFVNDSFFNLQMSSI